MARITSRPSHKVTELERIVIDFFSARGQKNRPYIEMFSSTSENITQQHLGNLLGFFRIRDTSADSAYIVNFLTSVVKKEYFINPHRATIDSFESTLAKTNRALAELAEHDNTSWLGNIDGIICSFEKNHLHFAVCGDARIILIRQGVLTDISSGLMPEFTPHPLKTFDDISSGVLEKDDQLIITTKDFFDVVSFSEILRVKERVSHDKFLQFLRTALVNEFELICMYFIQINSKKTSSRNKKSAKKASGKLQPDDNFNAFSARTYFSFEKPTPPDNLEKNNDKDAKAEKDSSATNYTGSINSDDTLSSREYIDKKTGHIYVQGESTYDHSNNRFSDLYDSVTEKYSDTTYWIHNHISRNSHNFSFQSLRTQLKTFIASKKKPSQKTTEKDSLPIIIENTSPSEDTILQETDPVNHYNETEANNTTSVSFTSSQHLETDSSSLSKVGESTEEKFTDKKNTFLEKVSIHYQRFIINIQRFLNPKILYLGKRFETLFQSFHCFTVHTFRHIRSFLKKAELKKRFIVFGCIILLVFGIFLLFYFSYSHTENPTPPAAETVSNNSEKISELPVVTPFSVSPFYSLKKVTALTTLNDTVYAITDSSLIRIDNANGSEEFPFNLSSDTFIDVASMSDLNMLFLLTSKGSVISFSPVSHDFTIHPLSLPDNTHPIAIDTYLTYIYLLDPTQNQIYRFPRVEGGFGTRTNWIREDTSLLGSTDFSVSEAIYILHSSQILQFFTGKQESYSIKKEGLLSFTHIYTDPSLKFLYALDSLNGIFYKISQDGTIILSISDSHLLNTHGFITKEAQERVYFINSDKQIATFDLSAYKK